MAELFCSSEASAACVDYDCKCCAPDTPALLPVRMPELGMADIRVVLAGWQWPDTRL